MSRSKAMDKEKKAFNVMVSEALYKPTTTGFICLICEHALIHPVTTTCNHTFCNYCISLWKKHNPYCPVCMETMGELKPALDINSQIEHFFKGADPGARKERKHVLAGREDSEARAYARFQDEAQETKSNRTHVSTEAPPHSPSLPRVPGQLGKLMSDTARLKRELDGIYSKILTVGTNLNAREDNLMLTKYSGGAMLHGSMANTQESRPSTAPSQKSSRRKLNQTCMGAVRPVKSISEIDELLDLTEDVLKIEDFLHRYSFERMLDTDPVEDDQLESDNAQVMDELDSISITKSGEVHLSPTSFRIHPTIQAFLDKNITTKIVPHLSHGRPHKGPHVGTSARDVKSRQSLASTIIKEIAAVQALHDGTNSTERPPTPIPGGPLGPTDLTNEVLKCRETLLSLRTQTQVQGLGYTSSSLMSTRGSDTDLASSRSCVNVKLPKITLAPNPLPPIKKLIAPPPPPQPKPASTSISKLLKKSSLVELRMKKVRAETPSAELVVNRKAAVKKTQIGTPYMNELYMQQQEEKSAKKLGRNKGAMGDYASSTGGEFTDSTDSSGNTPSETSVVSQAAHKGERISRGGRASAAGGDAFTKEQRRARTSTSAQKSVHKKPSFK